MCCNWLVSTESWNASDYYHMSVFDNTSAKTAFCTGDGTTSMQGLFMSVYYVLLCTVGAKINFLFPFSNLQEQCYGTDSTVGILCFFYTNIV